MKPEPETAPQEFPQSVRRRCQFFYGCSIEEALALNEGFPLSGRGSPMEIYRHLRATVEGYGDTWEMTFPQWKGAWDASGKWSMRGMRPGKYYMKRKNPKGPHSVENCVIVQCRDRATTPKKLKRQEQSSAPYVV